jgi:hypothetical protein
VNFLDPVSNSHTNTIECLWRHAKEVAGSKSRRKHLLDGHLAKYLFLKKCRAEDTDPFEVLCQLATDYAQSSDASPRKLEYQALMEQLNQLEPEPEKVLPMPDDSATETDYETELDDAEKSDDDTDWEPDSDLELDSDQ